MCVCAGGGGGGGDRGIPRHPTNFTDMYMTTYNDNGFCTALKITQCNLTYFLFSVVRVINLEVVRGPT